MLEELWAHKRKSEEHIKPLCKLGCQSKGPQWDLCGRDEPAIDKTRTKEQNKEFRHQVGDWYNIDGVLITRWR